MINLPDMTVEARNSTTAHGIPAPSNDSIHRAKELALTIELNHCATQPFGMPDRVVEILQAYSPVPFTKAEAMSAIREVFRMSSWRDVCVFVRDEMCAEFFNMCLEYCLDNKEKKRELDLGFIDGDATGYLKRYVEDCKESLEKCFDAKYFFKRTRPLVLAESMGMNLRTVAGAVHPGHWSYPAGHGTKAACAVNCLKNSFNLSPKGLKTLTIAAVLMAQGRSGNLIHFPEDNYASFKLFPPLM